MTRLLARARRDDGFTVIEAVIAIALTLIVTTTALNVLDRAYANNDDIQRKAQAQYQVRQAIDSVTRLLRSQVCIDDTTRPISAASSTSITFYADFGDAEASDIPERHMLTLDTTKNQLVDTVWAGGGTAAAPTWTGTGTKRVLASNVVAISGVPPFHFYGYNTATPPVAAVELNTTSSATVATGSLASIARIEITLRGNPPGRVTGTTNTFTLRDQVFVRLANPNASTAAPTCT